MGSREVLHTQFSDITSLLISCNDNLPQFAVALHFDIEEKDVETEKNHLAALDGTAWGDEGLDNNKIVSHHYPHTATSSKHVSQDPILKAPSNTLAESFWRRWIMLHHRSPFDQPLWTSSGEAKVVLCRFFRLCFSYVCLVTGLNVASVLPCNLPLRPTWGVNPHKESSEYPGKLGFLPETWHARAMNVSEISPTDLLRSCAKKIWSEIKFKFKFKFLLNDPVTDG